MSSGLYLRMQGHLQSAVGTRWGGKQGGGASGIREEVMVAQTGVVAEGGTGELTRPLNGRGGHERRPGGQTSSQPHLQGEPRAGLGCVL